jgi:hypothetical protein
VINFLKWATSSPVRIILVLQLSYILFPLLQSSFFALIAVKNHTKNLLNYAGITIILSILIASVMGINVIFTFVYVLFSLSLGLLYGTLLKYKISFIYIFQILTILSYSILLIISLMFVVPYSFIDQVLIQLSPAFESSNVDISIMREVMYEYFYSSIVWLLYIYAFVTLILSYAWCSHFHNLRPLFDEFTNLRLGQFLGIATIAIYALSFFFDLSIINQLAMLCLTALFIAGLSFIHFLFIKFSIPRQALFLFYLMFFIPISSNFLSLILVIIGIMDVFLNLRKFNFIGSK